MLTIAAAGAKIKFIKSHFVEIYLSSGTAESAKLTFFHKVPLFDAASLNWILAIAKKNVEKGKILMCLFLCLSNKSNICALEFE